jgi:hypothetical protein
MARKPSGRWATTLLIGTALVSSPSCGIADEGRFARSVESMERAARIAGPGGGPTENPQEIGGFAFDDVYRDGDRVYFKLGDHSNVDPYGYVWSPKVPPADDPGDATASSFEHIQGHWYRWSESY